MSDHEQLDAAATDRYITGRQQANNTPLPTLDLADVAVIEALQQLAATTTADPAFVARLATQLDRQVVPQRVVVPVSPVVPATPARWWLRLHWRVVPRRLALALAIFLVVSTLGVLVTTPAARATVWDLLYGFGLVNQQEVADQTVPAIMPTEAVAAPAPMDWAEIKARAGFDLPTPHWLPADLILTGGFVEQTTLGTQVTLAYHLTPPPVDGYALDAPLLFLVISEGPIDHRPLVAEEALTPLHVGDAIGMYARGNWAGNPAPDRANTLAALQWDSTLDATWLTWQQAGLNCLLYTQGLGVDRPTTVRIAESMAK